MYVIDKKILVKEVKEKVEDSATQKIGGFDYNISGNNEYVTAEIVSIASDGSTDIKVGQKVYIYTNAGKKIKDPKTKEEYRVIPVNEIIAVLD